MYESCGRTHALYRGRNRHSTGAALTSDLLCGVPQKIERTKSKLLNSLGSMDKRQPNDIGEINGYIDEVIVKLFPELKIEEMRLFAIASKRSLGIERQRPTPS